MYHHTDDDDDDDGRCYQVRSQLIQREKHGQQVCVEGQIFHSSSPQSVHTSVLMEGQKVTKKNERRLREE